MSKISIYFKKRKYLKPDVNLIDKKIPWVTFTGMEWLEKNLKREMNVFEWGSGGSTLFYNKRVRHLVSVEHNKDWYKLVLEELQKHNIGNVDYFFVHPMSKRAKSIVPGDFRSSDDNYKGLYFTDYCRKILDFPDDYFDLVAVDGRSRISCIFLALKKIKSGGYLLLDNSERDEYYSGISLLKNWKRLDFDGHGPRNPYAWRTSVFQKT